MSQIRNTGGKPGGEFGFNLHSTEND
jgi:hypothetical protein